MQSKYNKLIRKLCRREGKQSQIKVGDMREIVGVLAEELVLSPGLYDQLRKLGMERIAKQPGGMNRLTRAVNAHLGYALKGLSAVVRGVRG